MNPSILNYGVRRLAVSPSALMLSALLRAILMSLLLSSPVPAQSVDRSKPPEPGPPPRLKLAKIQHLKLSNGLPVVLMEKHELPLVEIELIIRAGAVNDPPELDGRANLTASMMEDGAGSRDALRLSDAIDFLGADISAFGSVHTSGVSLHSPLSKLDPALALFADIALRPTFPGEELDRERKERLTTLAQWHDEPPTVASVLFNSVLYGQRNPYGLPLLGSEQTLRSLNVEALKQFHDRYFHPGNGSLVVVGDVTAESLLPKLEAVFGSWKAGTSEGQTVPAAEQPDGRSVYLADMPGAAQSEIRIGRIGVDRLTEDYFPILVMNTILGGSFTSRLNHNLREEKGYTYGAASSFDFRPFPGPFSARAAVQTDVTDKALAEFMKELNGIRQPVTGEELSRAKNYLTLRYPENFETVSQIAGQLVNLVLYRLPDDYFDKYSERIRAVTVEDVQRVAQKYIVPEKMAIVIVGDRKKIEPAVSALNLGPLHNLTVDDVLGPAPKTGE